MLIRQPLSLATCISRRSFAALCASGLFSAARAQDAATPPPLRLALVAPEPGDDYFNALRLGVLEKAAAVAGTQVTYTSPSARDAAKQAQTILSLVEERYDAIIVAPDEGDAVLEACGQAVQAGIKVISLETALPPQRRHLHIATPDPVDFAATLLSLLNGALNKKGEVALLSTSPADATHLAVTKVLKKEWLKPEFADVPLITTVFAGQTQQEAYEQAIALVQTYPTLTGLLAFTREATLGAARAVADLGKANTIKLVGVGLPSRLLAAVKSGVCPAFLTWNPLDIGFAAATVAIGLAQQSITIQPGLSLDLGTLGQAPIRDDRSIALGKLVTADAKSIDALAEEY
jgi:rhamnose transport system substrate-binding protein